MAVEDDPALIAARAQRAEQRAVEVAVAESAIMTPRSRRPATADGPPPPPSDSDALTYLMGWLGWKELAIKAAVCRAWKEAARAKLDEWAVLSHHRVSGSGLERHGAIMETADRALLVCDEGNRTLKVFPSLGQPPRTIDSLIITPDLSLSEDMLLHTGFCVNGVAADVPLRAHSIGGLTVDDGGTVLLGLWREGEVLRTTLPGRAPDRAPPSGCVVRVRISDGALLRASVPREQDPLQLARGCTSRLRMPAGMAFANGRVFVCDKGCVPPSECGVLVLDAASLALPAGMTFAEATAGRGVLSAPQDVAVDIERDEMWVADRGQHRLFVFSMSSPFRLIRKIGQIGGGPLSRHCPDCLWSGRSLPGNFHEPVAVCVTRWRVFVGEAGNRGRLQVLSKAGHPLQVFKLPGTQPIRAIALGAPRSAFGPAQNLYVSVGAAGGLHQVHVGRAALSPA